MRKDFAAPSRIETPPSGSPAPACWSAVRRLLPELSDLLGVDIALMDADGACVGGTGPYLRGVLPPSAGDAAAYSLRTGKSSLLLMSGDGRRACAGRGDTAEFTGPVLVGGKGVAALRIVAGTGDPAGLLVRVEKAFELIRRVVESAWAREAKGTPPEGRFPELAGESAGMRELRKLVAQAAAAPDATVLLQGEPGTGKALAARVIHDNGARRDGPFVALDCGAIPESLMESELFGYGPGVFSGNAAGREGLLEQAHGGTLFLDEVSRLPLPLQADLLRVLQDRVVRRVGGADVHAVDIRVISSSDRDLRELVAQGLFREDLLFRLDVMPLYVPPLRDRPEDIRLLAARFLQEFSRDRGVVYRVAAELMHAFEAYPWPGNVQELKNFVEYGVSSCEDGVLTPDLLASCFKPASELPLPKKRPPARPASAERERILRLLDVHGRHTEGKKLVAADLGVSLATLYRRMHQLGITPPKEPWGRKRVR